MHFLKKRVESELHLMETEILYEENQDRKSFEILRSLFVKQAIVK